MGNVGKQHRISANLVSDSAMWFRLDRAPLFRKETKVL